MENSIEEDVEVLFITNDAGIAELYRLKLEPDGYHVQIVSRNGARLSPDPSAVPDLVYLDLQAGDAGPASLEAVRSHPFLRCAPLILLSNESPGQLRRRGFKLGRMDYVVTIARPMPLSESISHWAHRLHQVPMPPSQPDWAGA